MKILEILETIAIWGVFVAVVIAFVILNIAIRN